MQKQRRLPQTSSIVKRIRSFGNLARISPYKAATLIVHRVPTSIPPSTTRGKADKNHFNEEITLLLPTGIYRRAEPNQI